MIIALLLFGNFNYSSQNDGIENEIGAGVYGARNVISFHV